MSALLVVLVALAAGLLSLPVQAAADSREGDRDPSYGNAGIVTDPGPLGLSPAVTVQPDDGKAVVAGHDGGRNVVLRRYDTDGRPDASFGAEGKVITPINHAGATVGAAVAVQPDRKIVVAGSVGNGLQSDFVVVRYQPDGSPDRGFGIGGQVLTDFGYERGDSAFAVAIHDGKIVVAGTTATPGRVV